MFIVFEIKFVQLGNEIYNSLNDKRNCISEYARIKKAVPKEFVQI
jgi:hypothetical protein